MIPRGFSTRCIHAGTLHDESVGGVCSPVHVSSAFAYPNASGENIYPRYFNSPNQRAICAKISALEQGEDALAFGSGMAAISTTLLALLNPGDHAVFQADLYGGTLQLVSKQLERLGIGVSFVAGTGDFAAAIRPETKLIYVESPSNPLLRCVDLTNIAALGRDRGLLTLIDNTFATPYNQTPLTAGFDLVLHSATKYLNGHSDLNAGFVVGSAELIERIRPAATHFGGMLDARACELVERGMKTLALRMERHNANALALAMSLSCHPAVQTVHYPGLPGHPDHAVAARQMRGFSGMLSFEVVPAGNPRIVLNQLCVATPALSLGGVETLVCIPAITSHRELDAATRRALGISDGLIRVSVGVEDIDDLIDDFCRALDGGTLRAAGDWSV
jgi:cystathionine beta-lyase